RLPTGPRLRVDLDAAGVYVDDPVLDDLGGGIELELGLAVESNRGVRHLHYQHEVIRVRMPCVVFLLGTGGGEEVRLRFAVRKRDGILDTDDPVGTGKQGPEAVEKAPGRFGVGRLGHELLQNDSVDQLALGPSDEYAGVDHPVVFLNRDQAEGSAECGGNGKLGARR